MGSLSFKELSAPHFSMPAHFMSKNSGPRLYVYKNVKFYWQSKITLTIMRNVPVRQDFFFYLINALQDRFPNQHTEWNAYLNWHVEACKSLQDSQIASLEDSLPKTQEVSTTKDCKIIIKTTRNKKGNTCIQGTKMGLG